MSLSKISSKVAIVSSPLGKHGQYIQACKDLDVEYIIIDAQNQGNINILSASRQYRKVFFAPPCDSVENKLLYNDLVRAVDFFGGDIYPSQNSLDVYENKRLLSYVLYKEGVPAPATYSINSKASFLGLVREQNSKLIFKSVVGSGSSSVYVIEDYSDAKRLARKVFGFSPALSWGMLPKKRRFGISFPMFGRAIRHNFVLQEYCDFLFEWRVILIGKYCMAYKKEKGKDGLASGSGEFSFGLPSDALINFVVDVSQKLEIDSAAFDVFETEGGEFLVNEVQCNFACRVKNEAYPNATMFDDDGNPCMLVVEGDEKKIVYGEYAHNACHNLKVAHALGVDILETDSKPVELPQ